MRSEKAYVYCCSNERCRELFYFKEKQPSQVRIACPACTSIIEFLRPPIAPGPFTKPTNPDGTTTNCVPKWNPDLDSPIHVDSADPQSIIADRELIYGSFAHTATISRALKHAIYCAGGQCRLTASQHEALDLICSKISRIISGDPNYIDNWADIAGYATLIVNDLTEAEERAGERPQYDPPANDPD